jgi:hypothetical protein
MSNRTVLETLIIGSPTTNVGQFNLFGDGSVSGTFNTNSLVSDGAFSLTANSVISNSGVVKVIDTFHCDDYRAATYQITVDGSSGAIKRYLFTTFYVLQDDDDVYTTEQGTLFNRTLGTFSANLDTSKTASTTNIVNLLFTPTTSEKLTIKFVRTALFK